MTCRRVRWSRSTRGIDEPCRLQLRDGVLQVGILFRLESPHKKLGSVLQRFQFGGQQVEVRSSRVRMKKAGNNKDEILEDICVSNRSHLATIGLLRSGVFLVTLLKYSGGMWRLRYRFTKPGRISTSFSPFTLFGMDGPEKTNELKRNYTVYWLFKKLFLPNDFGPLKRQKFCIGILGILVNSLLEIGLGLSKTSDFRTEKRNLLSEACHGGWMFGLHRVNWSIILVFIFCLVPQVLKGGNRIGVGRRKCQLEAVENKKEEVLVVVIKCMFKSIV